MNLYLLRHGIAVEPGTPDYEIDADRPLTSKGGERMRDIAGAMQALELSFDCILTSPYLRARQTAEIVADKLEARKKLHSTPHLAPGGDPKKLFAELNRLNPAPRALC